MIRLRDHCRRAIRTLADRPLAPLAATTLTLAALLVVLRLTLATPPAAHAQNDPPPTTTPTAAPTIVPRQLPVGPERPAQPIRTRLPATRTSVPPTETRRPSIATASATPTRTPDPDARILENEERPIVVVEGVEPDPGTPAAGQTFRLRLYVANVGEHFAENIQLTLSSSAFLPVDRGGVLWINHIDEGETHEVDIQLRAGSELESGVYPVSIGVRWDDSYGMSYADETSLGIPVTGRSTLRPFVVVTTSRLPGRVAQGTPFSAVLELLNSGQREARELTVVPTSGPLALQGAGAGVPLTVPAGGTASVRLAVTATGEPGPAAQTFELRYVDPDGTTYTESHTVGLTVVGSTASGPLPMVVGCAVCDGRGLALTPGQVFDLDLTLENVGAAPAVRTRLSLGGGSAPGTTGTSAAAALDAFAPLGTSNVRYLGTLDAGQRTAITQRMVVAGTAEPGVYTLEIGFSYNDPNGQSYQSSEIVTLLVHREVAFEINPVELVTRTVVGGQIPFVVELINAGDDTLSVTNAEVTADPALAVDDGSIYIGPLDVGGIDVLDVTLTGRAPADPAQVTVRVHYRDAFQQTQVITESFEIVVDAAPTVPTPSPDAEADAPGERSLIGRVLRGLLGLGASQPPTGGPSASDADVGGPRGNDGESLAPQRRAPAAAPTAVTRRRSSQP